MDKELIKEINHFLTKGDNSVKIKEDDNLFQQGYLNSIEILDLISLIENRKGKEFDPDLLNGENFSTLKSIYSLIDEYLK